MRERTLIAKLLKRLHRQPLRKFPALRKLLEAPGTQGVYVIRDPGRQVLHVGRTLRAKKGLHQRLRNHLRGTSSFARAYLRGKGGKLRSGYTFQYLELEDSRNRVLLEYAATVWLCPRHLGVGKRALG